MMIITHILAGEPIHVVLFLAYSVTVVIVKWSHISLLSQTKHIFEFKCRFYTIKFINILRLPLLFSSAPPGVFFSI